MTYINLTQTLTDSMPVYPGDPEPRLRQIASIGTDGFSDHELTIAMHVGTHMDAPLHMIEGGKKISDLPAETCIGNGKLLDARGNKEIDSSVFNGVNVLPGDIVLVYTGWSKNFRNANYYTEYPVLTEDFAQAAIDFGVKVVGLDTPSPDHKPYNVHHLLLATEILIIENLANLDALVGIEKFEVIALPAPWPTDAAPVRVVAHLH